MLFLIQTSIAFLTVHNPKYDTAFPGHIYLIDNIRKVLKGDDVPAVKPEETVNVSKIIEMFYTSAEKGKEIFEL